MLTKTVTKKVSPPVLSVPMAYFMLFLPAVWEMLNERGWLLSKNPRTICRAWLLLQLLDSDPMLMSRLSANQADRLSPSPREIYLEMGTKTSYSPF